MKLQRFSFLACFVLAASSYASPSFCPLWQAGNSSQDSTTGSLTKTDLENLNNIDYFSTRLDHMTEMLNLTADQQAKIKPILEQESGELARLRNNPSVSRKQKIKDLKAAVLKSDLKMKPALTADQWQKLQQIREQQKVQLKEIEKQK